MQQLFNYKAGHIVKLDIKQVTLFAPVSSVPSPNSNMIKTSLNSQSLFDTFSF